jgi:hypothetical protein
MTQDITVLQLPKFKAEATKLIGADGVAMVAAYLIDHLEAVDFIPGAGTLWWLRGFICSAATPRML